MIVSESHFAIVGCIMKNWLIVCFAVLIFIGTASYFDRQKRANASSQLSDAHEMKISDNIIEEAKQLNGSDFIEIKNAFIKNTHGQQDRYDRATITKSVITFITDKSNPEYEDRKAIGTESMIFKYSSIEGNCLVFNDENDQRDATNSMKLWSLTQGKACLRDSILSGKLDIRIEITEPKMVRDLTNYGQCKNIGTHGGCVTAGWFIVALSNNTLPADISFSDAQNGLTSKVPDPSDGNISKTMCQAYKPVVENSINYRNQGIPVSAIRDTVSSALNTDENLYRFLVSSIDEVYRNPNGMRAALSDGRWLSACAAKVAGQR